MTPLLRRSAPLLAALAGVGLLYAVRPGVVENALRSPVAWAVVTGTFLAGIGVRELARRLGASPAVAQVLGTGVVVALVAVVLLPSFQQRTLVEDLPDELTAAAGPISGPAVPLDATPDPRTTTGTPTGPVTPTAAGAAPTAAPRTTTPTQQVAPAPVAATTRPAAQASSRPVTQQPQQPQPAPATVDRRGELEGIGHTASGTVLLRTASGKAHVVFSDVNIEGTVEPSVHLVPNGARTPSGGIRLGALKAEKGTFSYQLPDSVDLTKQWSVLVWCDPYDTPIAAADPR